jgi:hypothetical protein
MILSDDRSRIAAYREAGHIVFCHIYGIPFAHIGYNEHSGHIHFEDFSGYIQQTLVGKPKAMRAEIQENAALILVAGRIVASRASCRAGLEIVAVNGMRHILPAKESIHQPEYENVITLCRAMLWFQLPLSVYCNDAMQHLLIEARIRYLSAQAAAILLDSNVWSTVEVVAAKLIQDQELEDHDKVALQILELLDSRLCGSTHINGYSEDSYEEWHRVCLELHA